MVDSRSMEPPALAPGHGTRLDYLFVPEHQRPPAGRGLPVRCSDCGVRGMTRETGWHLGGCPSERR